MANVPVLPTTLVAGTASATLTDAGAANVSIAAAATNVWLISLAAATPLRVSGERLVLKFIGMASSVITIQAGDRPPSQRAGLGVLTFAIANTEVKYIVVDTGRHLKSGGYIVASVDTGDTTKCGAFILPKFF